MPRRLGITGIELAALCGFCGGALLHAWFFNHVCDDAFISFRYAQNLVAGDGLVFNVGEHVMGYSNLLWVLLLSVLSCLGISEPLGAKLLGTVFAWGTLLLVYFHLRGRFSSPFSALVAVGMLVTNGTFALWMFGGLEGHLFAFLLTAAAVLAVQFEERPDWRAPTAVGLLLSLLVLTRPEGLLFAAGFGLWLLWRRPSLVGVRQSFVVCGLPLLVWLVLLVWSLYYYGDPLPNTYYAKAHPLGLDVVKRGLVYSGHFLRANFGVPVVVLGLWLISARRGRRDPGWLAVLLIGAFLFFFLSIGGDALVYYRMWLTVLPFFALLVGEALGQLSAGALSPVRRQALLALVVVLVVLPLVNSFVGRDIAYLRKDDVFVRDLAAVAEALRELPEGTIIAANNVGVLSYGSPHRIVDMLGLTDRHIARAPDKPLGIPGHESHDPAYVLGLRPDLIILGSPRVVTSTNDTSVALYPSDHELLADPRFQQHYSWHWLSLKDGRKLLTARRRDGEAHRLSLIESVSQ